MIRRLIEFAVDKNILNHIFFLFLIVLAVLSYTRIPKEIFPPSNLDAISVNGAYAGTSPEVLDKIAVKEIEDELNNLGDIDRIESAIKNGSFSIIIYLQENANPNEILDEVKDVVASKQQDFPSDMDEPVAKIMTTTYPLVSVAIASQSASKQARLELAQALKSELSYIKDLSDIIIRGDADKELVFRIDERKLSAFGLSPRSVSNALGGLSEIFPVGVIKEKGSHLFISTYSGEKSAAKFDDIILNLADKRIRLGDVATASFEFADAVELSRFNGKPNLSISINKAETGNAIHLVSQIKSILKEYSSEYKDYTFQTYSDTSVWIRNRLNTVISNILFGLILVSLAVWVFISGRIAAVVGIGIPMSFMIGLISAELLGYSLNMLSLLGALIALGMLVDEAIVVAENIYRHLEQGDSPREAAINGATEMFPAVLTATATTIFAFLPLLIISGEMGVFMRILPIMISILLLSSLFEAFFFLPLHAKDILKVKNKEKRNESFWRILKKIYKKSLGFLLHHKKVTLLLFFLFTTISVVLLFKASKFQLFPDFDTTEIHVSGQININNDIYDTQKLVNEVETILLENLSENEVSSIASITGFKLDEKYRPHVAENNFHIFINLYERAPENFFNTYINPYLSPEYDDSDMRRERSAKAILEDINTYLKDIRNHPQFEEFKAQVPGAGVVESDVEIAFSGEDLNLVSEGVLKIAKELEGVDGVYNIDHDMRKGKKELKLRVNNYGYSLGFDEKSISAILKPYFFKAQVAKMFYNDELITIRTQEQDKDRFESLKNFYITVPSTRQKVRLVEVVDFSYEQGYANIYKDNGIRVSSVYASTNKEKITSAELFETLDPFLDTYKNKGLSVTIKGEAKENAKIQKEMTNAAIIAVFLIFITLVWMFDSIVLPFLLLSSIPLSLFGVLGGHELMGINLTMPGLLGIVGLSGVVVNDGIIMMDFLKRAKSFEDVVDLAAMRLRPILLTSITTILGLSTLIFFAAGQAVILQPMAISLGFGLAWATLLNLVYVPVLYSLVRRKQLNDN